LINNIDVIILMRGRLSRVSIVLVHVNSFFLIYYRYAIFSRLGGRIPRQLFRPPILSYVRAGTSNGPIV